MLEIGAIQFFHGPLVAVTSDIQQLSKTHEIISRSKAEFGHRLLTHYLPLSFPEAERFYRSARSDRLLAFVEQFPSPHMISAMTKPPRTWSAGRFPKRCFFQTFTRRPKAPSACLLHQSPTPCGCCDWPSPRAAGEQDRAPSNWGHHRRSNPQIPRWDVAA